MDSVSIRLLHDFTPSLYTWQSLTASSESNNGVDCVLGIFLCLIMYYRPGSARRRDCLVESSPGWVCVFGEQQVEHPILGQPMTCGPMVSEVDRFIIHTLFAARLCKFLYKINMKGG